MMCLMMIIPLCLALLVSMAGLFLLAYAKKEGLGKLTKITAYVAVLFGTVLFVGGIACSLMCGSCHKSSCDKEGMKCKMEMRKECSGSSCEKGSKECCKKGESCEKGSKKCCKEGSEKCEKTSEKDDKVVKDEKVVV